MASTSSSKKTPRGFGAEPLRYLLRTGLRQPLQRMADSSALARAFASRPRDIPRAALLRHAAEHVHRIRMFRPLDSAAATRLSELAPGRPAELWARYARSEAVHDRYFLRDLRAAGVDFAAEGVFGDDQPFAATRRLGAFMDEALRSCGPLPVVLYSFWAEENSEQGSPRVAARMRAEFGDEAARGATGHRHLDATQDHALLVSEVLDALIADEHDLALALGLLETVTGLLADYFGELTEWALAHADMPAPAAQVRARTAAQALAADTAARAVRKPATTPRARTRRAALAPTPA